MFIVTYTQYESSQPHKYVLTLKGVRRSMRSLESPDQDEAVQFHPKLLLHFRISVRQISKGGHISPRVSSYTISMWHQLRATISIIALPNNPTARFKAKQHLHLRRHSPQLPGRLASLTFKTQGPPPKRLQLTLCSSCTPARKPPRHSPHPPSGTTSGTGTPQPLSMSLLASLAPYWRRATTSSSARPPSA